MERIRMIATEQQRVRRQTFGEQCWVPYVSGDFGDMSRAVYWDMGSLLGDHKMPVSTHDICKIVCRAVRAATIYNTATAAEIYDKSLAETVEALQERINRLERQLPPK